MKSTAAAPQTFDQEDCDVWLDTVELKGKAKQKRRSRPISKLLNPFCGGAGYSLAVALNFTQTKTEMPKTKQSSISAFFTAHRKVLNKMSTTEPPNMDSVQPLSSSASTTPTATASGKKRGRNSDFEPVLVDECKSENVTEKETELWQTRSENHSTLQNIYWESEEEKSEECEPPQSKRRVSDSTFTQDDSQPLPQTWSQDPLFTFSQYTENEFHQTNHKCTAVENFRSSEPSFLNSLQNEEEVFRKQIGAEGRTSTQKSFNRLHSSHIIDEKENSTPPSYNSPSKDSSFSHFRPVSNYKWTQAKTASPRKQTGQLWEKAAKEESSAFQIKRTKLISSPLKRRMPQQRSRELDEDSLATLFTQDSEGFRVIAHRGLDTRSPLKDQSNVSMGVVSAYKFLPEEEEEDEEMLFTQDSQGNVVIKH
ncbi:aurora kinase A and ninein-interacting protein [Oreochromis aureus]|nr:aurora kinase A and ninein-interacting protein [Oreochromis aureus]